MVHVLPEKIAHKRHHPQRDAIQTLCLLSLVFGGLLWPIAWLWAYTKPVGYRMAYGTEKHEDYFHEMGEKAQAGELLEHELAHLRDELDAMAAKGTLTAELKVLRRDLAAATPAAARRAGRGAGRARGVRREGRERLMEALLLAHLLVLRLADLHQVQVAAVEHRRRRSPSSSSRSSRWPR